MSQDTGFSDLTKKKKIFTVDLKPPKCDVDVYDEYKESGLIITVDNESVTYLGHRIADQKSVAIKHVKTKYARQFLSRGTMISMEAAILQELADIPGVSRLTDHYRDDYEHVIVTEFVPKSPDLHLLIGNCGKLPEQVAKYIFKQLLEILAAIEEKGIFHGNISSFNVFIEIAECKVMLANFNQAGFTNHPQIYVKELMEKLTTPPVWLTSKDFCPTTVNVWYLGVLVHQMLFNSMPSTRETLLKELAGSPMSHACIDLLDKCLNNRASDLKITFKELQKHPWFTSEAPCSVRVMKMLKECQETHIVKLKAIHSMSGCECTELHCWIDKASGKPELKPHYPLLHQLMEDQDDTPTQS